MEVHAELVGDHMGQRGLAEPRRAGEQEVIERPAVLLGGAHRDLEVVDQLALADVVVERARAQRGLPHLLPGALGDRDLACGVGRREGSYRIDVFLACQGVVILTAVVRYRGMLRSAWRSSISIEMPSPTSRSLTACSASAGRQPMVTRALSTSPIIGCRACTVDFARAAPAGIATGRTPPSALHDSSIISHFSCSSTTSNSAVFLPMP